MEMATGKRADVLERVYTAGNPEDLERAYDEWAQTYDEDVFKFGYLFPAVTAGYIGRHIPSGARIVDAGAGTGIMGRVIRSMGYDDITAFDLSTGMLDRARSLGVYRQLDRQVIGEPLKYETNEFDACVSVGTFTEGHAPATGFDEIARIVKPGGHFLVTIREDVYEQDGFKAKEAEMVAAGKMTRIDRSETFRVFSESEPDIVAHVYVYQII
jgi:predicted TPR repeat methyltransferase